MRLTETLQILSYLQALIFTDLTQVESLGAKRIGGVKVKVFIRCLPPLGG